jgi:hypothetical protein
VHRINARAETRTREQFVSDIARKVAGKENILFRIAAAAADKPDGIVEEVVYPAAGGLEVLLDLVREFESKGPTYRQARQRSFKASYTNHYRAGLIEGRFTRAAGLTSFPTWVEESSARYVPANGLWQLGAQQTRERAAGHKKPAALHPFR